MADTKISALTAVVTPATTDIIPVVQGGVTLRETVAQLRTVIVPIVLTADVSGTLPVGNGGWSASTAEALTNKTINGANNTLTARIANDVSGLGAGVATFLGTPSSANLATAVTDETGTGALVFGTAPLFKTTVNLNNPGDTFKYVITPAAIVADRTLTLPLLTGNDTVVTEAFAQTLTNKTISGAVYVSFGTVPATTGAIRMESATYIYSRNAANTADVRVLGMAADTVLVGGVGADVNMGYGGAGKNVSIAGDVHTFASGNAGATVFATMDSTALKLNSPPWIQDSSGGQQYKFAVSNLAADRTITLPLLAGNDTFVFEAFAQTLTNKTMVAASNTITDTSAATGDLFKHNGTRFVRLAMGTAYQVLGTNSGATDVAWTSGALPAFYGITGNASTGTVNDCTLGSQKLIRFTNATGPTVTGFDATGITEGTIITVYAAAATVAFTHEGAGSTATNRITLQAGITISLAQGTCTQFIYLSDGTNSRWRHMAATAI